MVWYSYLFKNFLQFFVIHTIKGFDIVNKPKVDVFLKLSHLLDDPMNIGSSIISHSLLQDIFPTQGLNPGLLH